MAFAEKRIDISFNYAAASVGQKSFTGLRVSLVLLCAGSDCPQLEMAIFGLSLSDMNSLTLIGTEAGTYGSNFVTVSAGEESGSMSTVFSGNVQFAFADARGMPEVALRVSAYTAKLDDIKPVAPTSMQGSADVAQIAQQICGQMGLTLESNGVSVKLSNPYFHGSALTQLRNLARAAGINMAIDPDRPVLAIWPTSQARQGGGTIISPQTGMVGYPSYTASGIAVQTSYNP